MYETSLGKCEFPVHSVVVQFLQDFGGLEIVYPAERVPGSTHRLSSKANWVVGGLIAANGRACAEPIRIGSSTSPSMWRLLPVYSPKRLAALSPMMSRFA